MDLNREKNMRNKINNKQEKKYDKFAVVGFVLGIIGFLFGVVWPLTFIFSNNYIILAPIICTLTSIFFGFISKNRKKRNNDLSLAGIIVSIVSLLLMIFFSYLNRTIGLEG